MDKRKHLSKEVREARAAARNETRVVRAYLESLQTSGMSRGGRRKPLQQVMEEVVAALETERDPLVRLGLVQKRLETEKQLASEVVQVAPEDLEGPFIEVALPYSKRKNICRQAWREIGVPAMVLKASGI